MAKYQKLVNKAELHMTAWAASWQRLKNYPGDPQLTASLDNARNALLGFIGSLAGRNDELHAKLEAANAEIARLGAELATYKPQVPDGLPFDLEAAKAGKPMQVRRTEDDKTDWLDAHFIGERADKTIVFETKEYGMMTTKTYAGLRMVVQTTQLTMWANVYPECAGRSYLYYSREDALKQNTGAAETMRGLPVTITVAK